MSLPDHLDFGDPAAVRRFILDLRVAIDDGDAVTRDALRPLGRRELGRVLHQRNYREAREKIVSLLDFAMPPAPDGDAEPGGPAGNGGAGPPH